MKITNRELLTYSLATLFVASIHSASASTVTCNAPKSDDVRIIEIVADTASGLPCQTIYTKGNQREEIASAQHSREVCDAAAAKVIATLEAAAFVCTGDLSPQARWNQTSPDMSRPKQS
ncbi:MAG: hypothetical protein K0U93_07400 [Gammaproteobacteria bacterium]|nr:hypothetical protein [Gammaproteobacteria bacterium]